MTSTRRPPGDTETAGLRIRPAAVAGSFYPGRARALEHTVDEDLAAAKPDGLDRPVCPKALIVPHAGYIYSGAVAATAYARLLPWREQIQRVVLLGPAHRVAVRGLAVSSADGWETPLGVVTLDAEGRERVLASPAVVVDDRAHAPEHSLEVHLPFLQRILGSDFRLLPLVVGHPSAAEVADVLDLVWGGDETLIVISSDLSHYHDHATAQSLDRATAAAIVERAPGRIEPDDACGAHPVNGMLEAARRHDLGVELVDLRNSGDTAGPHDRVVGYGAFVLSRSEPDPDLDRPEIATIRSARRASASPEQVGEVGGVERRLLLEVAEEAIRARMEGRARRSPTGEVPALLSAPGASFVTLRDGERLLGCIGTLEPRQSLQADVAENALGAAFRDPRMPALTRDEFARMSLHISVLTPAVPMVVHGLDELRAAVRPGIDGLLIEAGRHRGTFLPSVWEQVPEPDEFLAHLWLKAGLHPGTWPDGLAVSRYGSVEFGDEGPRDPIT